MPDTTPTAVAYANPFPFTPADMCLVERALEALMLDMESTVEFEPTDANRAALAQIIDLLDRMEQHPRSNA